MVMNGETMVVHLNNPELSYRLSLSDSLPIGWKFQHPDQVYYNKIQNYIIN